jgi:hypothetical protein
MLSDSHILVISISLCIGLSALAKPMQSVRSNAPIQSTDMNHDAVLDANHFYGKVANAYRAAQSCPGVLRHLFPYCGTDVGSGEKSLLDSFTTEHAVDDPLCRDEAMLASELAKRQVPLGEIQKTIDERFQHNYPSLCPSPALKAYRASRLYIPKPAAADQGTSAAAPRPRVL